ncbi:site-specific integrase [Caproiciproducens galactitolivorans]|uniref:Tyrosine recombinase XerC n=1 Tax=Caproiciproducens galactitolivorans TaxID=642589 RepID=A0A4Z0YAN7_9FIRM|nr:site-specific integrase [Caproiciproducens galactitolivorans]QEY34658.1 site-specific integrase [Caproiciproducens galactitolivorans]TGJ75873.1 tyrosine recombinase XerC [Caproiciproducens galactitolivorans]
MPKKQNTKRDDGRIAVQVYLGLVDGKRKYKTVYGRTQKEADEKALQVKIEMNKGLDVTADQDTFSDWAECWLKIKQVSAMSEGQYKNYERTVKMWKERIGFRQIKKLRTHDFQTAIADLAMENPFTHRPSARRTLKFAKSTAFQVMQLAIVNRVIDYNPVTAVEIPQEAAEEHRRALTDEEQQWIIDTPHRAQTAAMIMMYAGLRRGELLALTWNDIDLEKKNIQVNKAVAIKNGKFEVKPMTKTAAGMRTVDIPQRLVNYLKNQPRKYLLVVPTVSGKLMTETGWKALWNSYMTALNVKYGERTLEDKKKMKKPGRHKFDMTIPPITPHWLRHTFATLLYLAGVDVLTAKEQLGHADVKTTLQIYTHLDKKYKRKSMRKLDAYLTSQNGREQAF